MELKVIGQGGQSNLNLISNNMLETSNKEVNEEMTVKEVDTRTINNTSSSEEKVEEILKKINKYLRQDKKHAEYSVHNELHRVMIKIVDDKTDKVLMEVPPEKLLDAAVIFFEAAGVLMDKKV